jgi:diguanylate cyclase (GGDEF)-like protein/PAS domain S-box-containing protein
MGALARILAVDDDATARLWTRASLHKAGYEVALAQDGADALRIFDEGQWDLVMLDVDMPGMNGIEVCAALRAKAGERLPIVMVTGMDDIASVEQAYEAGATDFIAKPLNWALLGHRVRYLLRVSAALRELDGALAQLETAHARSAAILHAIPDALFRVTRDGIVLDIRDGPAAGLPGEAPQAGRTLAASYSHDVAGRLEERIAAALRTGAVQDLAFSRIEANGQRRYFEARVATIERSEVLCLVRDVTQRKEAELQLVASQAKLEQAQAVARMGSWYYQISSGELEWSAETYRIFGLPKDTPVHYETFENLVHPDDRLTVRRAGESTALGQSHAIEYRIPLPGRVIWVLQKAEAERDDTGRVSGILGTVQDITERKETETRIARLAYFDSLTGLPNRESFLETLDREVRRAQLSRKRLAILFVDLDGFKSINDTLGHHAGDLLLQAAADRLRQIVRPGDVVSRTPSDSLEGQLARLGGDEFTALLLNLDDSAVAMNAANRLREQLCRPFIIEGRDLRLTASIGITVFPDDGVDASALMKHADTAMYHAKELGRNNCQFYSADLTMRAMQRMTIERDLRVALEQSQFYLEYQPQIDLRTGRVASVEALIRWNHPQRGLIAPLDFIPIAENNGLIIPIGQWVIRSACEAAARWRRQGHALRVAINLSAAQLKDPQLVPTVLAALADAKLPPALFELEVTESALMENSAQTMATLDALRGTAVRLGLDDFGTGYSSMSSLKLMPLSILKIDRSFIEGLPRATDNDSIVRAVVSMAHSLGLEVTAEGVETAEQARHLAQLQCDLLQGFYFGRPAREQDIVPLLSRRWSIAEGGSAAPRATAEGTARAGLNS